MAFYGNEFSFDGRSCHEFGLMLYDFSGESQEDVDFTSAGDVIGDTIGARYDNLIYGVETNKPLTYKLVFCVNEDRANRGEYLRRSEVNEIATWLTGHQQYKRLFIYQNDTDDYYYRCVITGLKLLTHGNLPWGFSCTVTCDSPYAYTTNRTFTFSVNETAEISINNYSAFRGYYKPRLLIKMTTVDDFEIINESDKNHTIAFSGLPADATEIHVDCLNEIIDSNSEAPNMYEFWNKSFLRLVPGVNKLTIHGNGVLQLICSFPINVGG